MDNANRADFSTVLDAVDAVLSPFGELRQDIIRSAQRADGHIWGVNETILVQYLSEIISLENAAMAAILTSLGWTESDYQMALNEREEARHARTMRVASRSARDDDN